jgi:deoxyribonuclease V
VTDIDWAELREQQREIASKAVYTGSLADVKRFVAVDMSSQSFYGGENAMMYAAAVVLERGSHAPLEVATASLSPEVPYRAGFLAFREAPVIFKAIEKLRTDFDLIWVDGHGLMHPRRAGIATQMGVLLGKASLGVGKTPLFGQMADLELELGSSARITSKDELLGFGVRLRKRANPVFVSPGNLCDPTSALGFVLEHADGYRQPWPSRVAHEKANRIRRELEEEPLESSSV